MRRHASTIATLGLTLIVLLHLVPIGNMVINSLRSNSELERDLIGMPTELHIDNYSATWVLGSYFVAYRNNIVIGGASALIVLTANSLAAYAVTKRKIFAQQFFTGYFFAALSIPGFAIIVPLYFMFQGMGLVNNHLGITLIYSAINIPFTFLFLRAFFLGIPDELEEAARIDGCSSMQALLHVTLPLSKPILLTTALIVFVRTWNEFLFGNTFLHDNMLRTVALRYYTFVGRYETELAYIYTGAVLSVMPVIVIFLLLQRAFISGMTSGALKG